MESVNPYILLGISMLVSVTYGALRNVFSNRPATNQVDYYAFTTMSGAVSTVMLLVMNGGMRACSGYTLAMGLVFGILTALAAVFTMIALRMGPMSYTMLIGYASMIIPSLSGRIFWGESVSAMQHIGTALMVVSMAFSVNPSSDDKKASLRWLAMSLVACIATGLIGVMQKMHQASPHSGELNEFLVIAFLVSTTFTLLMTVYARVKTGEKPTMRISPRAPEGWMALICGVCIALANQFNLYLSGAMDSMIFFPAVNGGGLLLAMIASVVIFHERLGNRQRVGLAIGTVSILLLCNIF